MLPLRVAAVCMKWKYDVFHTGTTKISNMHLNPDEDILGENLDPIYSQEVETEPDAMEGPSTSSTAERTQYVSSHAEHERGKYSYADLLWGAS